ncbi:hypothetical protein BHE74_00040739 [Ensete ventricosum]|nr:hypothetical protein BHE74_00040739 [Ensete ventricosum]
MVVFLFQDSRFSSLRTTLLKLELPKPIEYCRWSQFIMRDSVCGNRDGSETSSLVHSAHCKYMCRFIT